MGAYVSNFFRERVNSTTSSLVATQASAIPRFYPSNRLYSTTTTYKLEDEDGGDSDYESDPDDDFSDLCNHIYWGTPLRSRKEPICPRLRQSSRPTSGIGRLRDTFRRG